LSELFGGVEGEPVQVELCGVRVLFELLGFLLKCRGSLRSWIAGSDHALTGCAVSVYNGEEFNFLFVMRRT
jgi:hypothetical protein